jgi:hypothetical protein
MTRRPRNPSEDFSAGYEAGRAARLREHAIELDKLKALTALLEARLAQATARAEAAEKKLAKNSKRAPKVINSRTRNEKRKPKAVKAKKQATE